MNDEQGGRPMQATETVGPMNPPSVPMAVVIQEQARQIQSLRNELTLVREKTALPGAQIMAITPFIINKLLGGEVVIMPNNVTLVAAPELFQLFAKARA